MTYVAEEVARFLHHACRGLPAQANTHQKTENSDHFYCLSLEYALGYFGSLVLYPARLLKDESLAPLNVDLNQQTLWTDEVETETRAQEMGYALGKSLYDAYLQGRINRCALRRLFLAQLDKPGRAKEICLELVNGLRPAKKKARAAAG